ncbi:MAG: GspE/PulE family protein [Verrucomicrobiia bacterium]
MRLGERLVEAGLLTQVQLDLALREQKRTGKYLGEVLSDLGFVQQEVIADFLAREARVKVIKLDKLNVDNELLKLVPFSIAKRLQVIPISKDEKTLTVAMADPFNVSAIDSLEQITGLKINVVTATVREILNAIDLYYTKSDTLEETIDKFLEQGSEKLTEIEIAAGEDASAAGIDPPVIRLVDQIITRAVNNRASDIHFEPEEKVFRVRVRIDGVLRQDVLIPKPMQAAVIARLKVMSEMDVAEHRIPQDGRASIYVGRREINLRFSCIPTAHGENIVIRILDPSSQILDLKSLGMSPKLLEEFENVLRIPYGVILVTGPTGSGKTTTLYSALNEVSTMERSVYTLEDPIEYKMPLIRQTQINEEAGMTFAAGLRSILRQDPDVILVGETRDTETAMLMIRAALTGHLVFSTLHTNNAVGAIPRLIDMGVEPYLLPSSLFAVLAQRLTRTICPHCKEEIPNAEQVFENLNITPPPGMIPRLWRGRGCSQCKETGYTGRIGIFELLRVDESFHEAIVRRSGAQTFFNIAREKGMDTMFDDGVKKAVQGITTLEEVLRVTRLAEV